MHILGPYLFSGFLIIVFVFFTEFTMQTQTYSYLVWQVEELSKRSEMGGEFFSESWKPAPSTISAMMIPT